MLQQMRHLRYSRTDRKTLCGEINCEGDTVHFSKARKSDCAFCRYELRLAYWKRRALNLEAQLYRGVL